MSIPTNVLENAQWVTRWVDPYHMVERNRIQQEERVKPSAETPKPPSLGVLTKTLVRTPVLKWIIPARIRHRSRNDVLFISTDHVEVKEARGEHKCDHVFVRSDFDSPIRAARILGLPRELTKPDINAVIKREEHWRYDLDDPVKAEADEYGNAVKNEDEAWQNDGYLPYREFPPQILVLVLESCKIIFLYAISGAAESLRMVTSQYLLPPHHMQLEKLGEHLAVDPKSRAMAVAAQAKTFCLYSLKSMGDMEEEIKRNAEICPVKDARKFEVDGIILKMEFLHPPQKDSGQVILLLVVSKDGRSRLVWYEWNPMTDLRLAQITPSVQSLPSEDRMPLLLIPLRAFTAFILISEKGITLFKNLLTGTPNRYTHKLMHNEAPEEAGSSKKNPIWVQWARPMRSEAYKSTDDCIYICREDGIVHYLEIKHNHEQMLDSTHKAGRLGVNISSSFAVLDTGPNANDILVTGGCASDGGSWRFRPRENAEQLSNRPNWTPLTYSSIALVPDQSHKATQGSRSNNQIVNNQQRLFACTGKAKYGSISEIRYGIPAKDGLQSVDLGEEVESGVLGVWTLHDQSDERFYVLIAHPSRTSLILIYEDNDPELLEEGLGLDLDVRTIAARDTTAGVVIQVTETTIRSTRMPTLAGQQSQQEHTFSLGDERVLTACIGVPDAESLTLLAVQEDDHYYLRLGQIDHTYEPIGERVTLRSRPVCLYLHRMGTHALAFMSDIDGMIQIFITAESDETIQMLYQLGFEGKFAICDSIAILTPEEDFSLHTSCLLVLGLRDGFLGTFSVEKTGFSLSLTRQEHFAIGHTSVTVIPDNSKRSRAIVHCDEKLYAFDHSASLAPASLSSIWLDSSQGSSMQKEHFNAVFRASLTRRENMLAAGALVCLEGSLLHFIEIDRFGGLQNVPRRFPLGGTPVRVIYSERLNKLVTLSVEVEVTRPQQTIGNTTRLGKRALRPVITFLEPDPENAAHKAQGSGRHANDGDEDHMQIDSEPLPAPNTSSRSTENANRQVLEQRSGERFLGIMEWIPKISGNEYHTLIINTMVPATARNDPSGRLLLYAVIHKEGEQTKAVLKKPVSMDAPVYSVIPYNDSSSIIYCCGEELWMISLTMEPSGLKWRTPQKVAMRSPARHLSVDKNYIYASTSNESLQVYKIEGARNEIVYYCGDQMPRPTLHHVNLPEHSMVVVTDMTCSITGLWQPPQRRSDSAMLTVFEAALPKAIVRLHCVRPPPWYQALNGRSGSTILGVTSDQSQSMVGTATDGTVYQVDPVEKGWRLLKFIQNLCDRHPLIRPFSFSDPENKRHPFPLTDDPHLMHIDGDILQRMMERGGERLLREMLDQDTPDQEDEEVRFQDFATVKERWESFKGLANEIIDVDGEDWFSTVVKWTGCALRSVL